MTEVKSVAVDFDPFAEGEIAKTIALTSHQRELWSAVQLGGDDANCAYNESMTLTLRGPLDVSALEQALGELAQRHDSLRTTFSAEGTALIAATGSLPLARVDLRGAADPAAAYRALEQEEVATAFDLTRGPLGRAVLAELADGDHRLFLKFHHIICDGWSFGVLVSELGALYSAKKRAAEAELEPPESYALYAEEHSEHEKTPGARASLNYWVDLYRDSVPLLELPTDRPRPSMRTYRAGRVDRVLPPALTDSLRSFAKQQNASMLQLLLTAFQTLLARLSNQWEVVVGISAAGQARTGRYNLVGHAVSYLPVRGLLAPEGSFPEALAQTKRAMGDALEHQDVTFGTILQNLAIPRDASRVPLAPVSFNLEQSPMSGGGFEGLEVSGHNVPRAYEVFELFANLVDRKREITVELQYNADLFDPETLDDWLESYQALLSSIVATPQEKLAKLPVLTPEARQKILETWNATRTPFERDTTIHGFFEQSVDKAPAHEALAFEGQRISYEVMETRANRLAHHLIKRGIGPESIVAVCVRRSVDMVVAQLGVLKAGAAYLPLDPTYPSERLQYMLADSGASLVLSRVDSLAALGQVDAPVVLMDEQRDALAAEPSHRPEPRAKGENIAYVIYTSGSTGKPKGVLVEHKNFANFLAGMDQRLRLVPAGVWLCATSIGFDISLLELFGALARGFTVVLHSDESGPEQSIPTLIKQHQVTHFQCTPSQATILLGDAAGREAVGQLRELLLGGEALPLDLAQQLTALLTRGRLVNMYGPTETTIWSTTHEVKDASTTVPIGRPIANTRIYVLDPQGEPVARGAVGELLIAGEGVTRGYHNRPELTSDRFVSDPFAAEPNARMYKTGDLARFRKDGEVEFLGRNDHQVKIRGYRIELGEIEVALRAHAAVRDAAVIAREDRPGDKRLVAYLVCDGAPTVQELKASLTHAGLPEYMLPQAFVTLAKLPATPNGKLDRRALPVPELESSLSVGKYVAPSDELEDAIAASWRQVLGLPRVGTEDNFFDLGGHSLLVVRLADDLKQRTGKPLAVPDLFRFPTVKSLASYLRSGAAGSADAAKRGADRRAATERRTTGRRG